ncbi:MAG: hypothetical protein RSB06_04890 [Clostridia bacterium]
MSEKKIAVKGEIIRKIWSGAHGEHAPSAQEIREIMDAEMSKPLKEIDNALVDRCSQLLCELYECKEAANASETIIADSKRNLRARIDRKDEHVTWPTIFSRRCVLRTIVATTACVVVIGMIGILTTHGSLKMQTSDNGEDYITFGETPAVNVLQNANADRMASDDAYTTTDLTDAFTHLGYEIDMPASLPKDVTLSGVDVMQDEVSDSLQCVYNLGGERVLQFDIDIIHDYEGVTIAREQNQNGEKVTLPSGKTVYTAQNLERNWALYAAESTIYQVTSNYYDLNTILRIIDSIGEE